jgi:hypothetical protein
MHFYSRNGKISKTITTANGGHGKMSDFHFILTSRPAPFIAQESTACLFTLSYNLYVSLQFFGSMLSLFPSKSGWIAE